MSDITDTVYSALEEAGKTKGKRIEKKVRLDTFIKLAVKAIAGDKDSSPKIEFQDTDGNTVVFVGPKGDNSNYIIAQMTMVD